MLYDGCETCERLWREYVEATHSHLKTVGKQRIAEIQNDTAALELLDPQENEAARRREEAQTALKAHQASHQPKVMTAR